MSSVLSGPPGPIGLPGPAGRDVSAGAAWEREGTERCSQAWEEERGFFIPLLLEWLPVLFLQAAKSFLSPWHELDSASQLPFPQALAAMAQAGKCQRC